MSHQFIFSPQNFEAIGKAAGLTKTVSFNRVMLDHYKGLYKAKQYCWIDPRRHMLLATIAMYQVQLENAMVQGFINDVNAQHNGPAITISS